MKFLKKINKGLVLTIIVLLVLIVYLVNVENQRKADKEEIQKTCEEFISFTDKYSVLPENMQQFSETISESKLEEYKKEMKIELEKLMIQNEEAVKLQYQILESNLEAGYNFEEIRTKSERKITKISSYEFEGDQVTVTFKARMKITSKYLNEENEEQENQKSIDTESDEIILQKIDGKWKVVYSNLRYDTNKYYFEDSIVIY